MNRLRLTSALVVLVAGAAAAQGPAFTEQPYRVLTRARVGGEGGFDYIYADPAGRRLYIPRNGTRAVPATDTSPARP